MLITAAFPYGFGETFLENEIPILAERFEKIFLFPKVIDNPDRIRKLPPNCHLSLVFIEGKINPLLNAFQILVSSWYWREVIHFLKNEKNITLDKFQFIYSFAKRGNRLFQLLNKEISDLEIDLKRSSFYSYWFMAGAMAVVLLKNRYSHIPKSISRAHRVDLYQNVNKRKYLPFKKFMGSNLDKIYSVSKDGCNYLRETYNIPAFKTGIARLGVSSELQKKDIQITKNQELQLISCSNFRTVKRVHLIALSLKDFSFQNDTKLRWTHIGGGDKIIKKEVQKIAAEFRSNVKFHLTGQMSNKEVKEYYASNGIDIFLNLSSSEGVPVSIMEAQSYGSTVIATDVGGVSEIVNNENGVLLSSNPKVKEIVLGLESLLNDEVILNKRIKSFENYSMEYNAAKNYKAFTNQLILS